MEVAFLDRSQYFNVVAAALLRYSFSNSIIMQRRIIFTRIFVGLLGAATLQVAFQALADPQSVMNNVQVDLGDNLTARNSLRAVYGGVNLLFGLFWCWAAFYRPTQFPALIIALLYTGGFVVGRLLSWVLDGTPGAFAQQWLMVEAVFCAMACALLWSGARKSPWKPALDI